MKVAMISMAVMLAVLVAIVAWRGQLGEAARATLGIGVRIRTRLQRVPLRSPPRPRRRHHRGRIPEGPDGTCTVLGAGATCRPAASMCDDAELCADLRRHR